LLAGQRGIPITVLPLTPVAASAKADDAPPGDNAARRDGEAERDVKAAAADSKKSQPTDDKAAPVDVTVRSLDAPTPEALAEEAEKGYDLLFIGIEHTRAKSGGFHRDLDRLAAAFEGPMAVVDARGVHLDRPEQSPLDILVPVNGTELSRRAAELAIAVARVFRAAITAFYVTALKANQRGRAGPRGRRYEQAILKEIAEIADQYDQEIATAVRAHAAPADAVVAEAERRGHNIVIMGVGRRPGDKLFFGETAAGVFERSPASVVFVAS
jgi:nucleotide-binding universal stress UspA family protein